MKSKRFNLSKVLLTFMFMMLSAVVLVACGDTDQDLVDQALETVAVTFSSGDTQDSVTKNLILPETIGDITVSWTSGNTAVISNAGVVTRPATDTDVELTATLTLGDVTESYTVTVTVIAAVVVIDPLDALEEIAITGSTITMVGSVYETTTDIVLPSEALGLAITWTTSNANYVALDGTVVRPNFGIADQVVTLTATIGGEEATFLIKVLAFAEKQVSQKLDEAKTALLLDGITGGVADDIELPATVLSEGVVVTWSSDDTTVIANDGTVTRPVMGSDDVTVILTATLSLSDESVTKEFSVLVLANIVPTAYDNIADVLANAQAEDFVSLEDVTVIGKTTDQYFLADSTGILLVHGADLDDVEVGTVYDIYGAYDIYYGSPQLSTYVDSSKPVVPTVSDGAVTELTPTAVDYMQAYTPMKAPTFGSDNIFVYEYLEITAKVLVQGTGSYDTVFVNADYDGDGIDTSANTPYSNDAFMIYYKSNKAAFNDLDGEIVRFNAILYGYRSDRTIFTIIFTGEAADIESSDDITAVALAKASLRGSFENEYIEADTLTLPVTHGTATTIAWATDSTLVDTTTGALTMPTTGYEEVTLTATITSNDEVGTLTTTFMVGDLPSTDILDARALEGHLVRVTGVITAAEAYRVFFIQDGTAGIQIYTSDSTFTTFLKDNVGKEVTILGELQNNYGLLRLNYVDDYALIGDKDMPLAINVDEFELTGAGMLPFQGSLVEISNLYVSSVYVDSYDNITLTLDRPAEGTSVTMKYDSRADLTTEAATAIEAIVVGDVISVVAPLSWDTYGNAPYLWYTSTTTLSDGTLSTEDEIALDALEIAFADKLFEAQTLTFPTTGTLGSTIAWESSDSALIDVTTGAVVMPTEGFEYVTLTATVTKGDAELVITYSIRLGVSTISGASDLFISEYIEGSSNNKAIEIYNGTGADVDLTPYSLVLYGNGDTSAGNTTDLSGTLFNGEVYVVYNASANQDIKDAGDEVSTVTYFNGNDAVALEKNGVVIDVMGEIGVNEYWTVGEDGALAENTLVRVDTVTGPNTVFTESEWVVYDQDTFTYLGAHTMADNSQPDIFISKYFEGSSYNKALELYNPSDEIVDLSVYTVELYSNGATTDPQIYTLTGTLAAGEVFIIANSGAHADILAVADVALGYPSVANWNGDDAVVLRKNGVILDIILSIGHPADQKDAGDVSWVRNASITAPNATFTLTEWTDLGSDVWTGLGSHTVS